MCPRRYGLSSLVSAYHRMSAPTFRIDHHFWSRLKMKILYVSQYFPPEMGAPAARVSELSRHWVSLGHDVTVLTGFPNHPSGVIHSHYKKSWRRGFARERVDGINVVRSWLLPLPNRNPVERILNYSSFCITASLRGLFLRRPDVLIATSPQLLVGLAGWIVARFKRTRFILEIRDIWPDGILASGVGREGSFFARSLSALSSFLYKRSDLVVVVTPAFKKELVTKWKVPEGKIEVVQNGVETELFSPDGSGKDLRADLGISDNFVVSYTGTIGMAHGLGTVLDAAKLARDEMADLTFLIVGDGAERERLRARIEREGLGNVRLVGPQLRARMPDFIRASDACLVTLKRAPAFETVIPSKMLEFMSVGKPVLLGVDGEARRLLEEAGGGLFVKPEDPVDLLNGIRRLRSAPSKAVEMGTAGRRFVVGRLSRSATAAAYLRVLEDVPVSR